MFFTAVDPMDTQQDRREVEHDLDKSRIAVYKLNGRVHHNTVCWCNLKLAQRNGFQFSQTRSLAITLSSTRPAICIEKVVCMKPGEELYCKVYKSPRLPRVTLLPNSQHHRKDVLVTDSRKSDNRESEVHKHRKTCGSNRVDFRIPGNPFSAVEQVETNRKESASRLIEQFENHPNRNMLLKDFEKSQAISLVSQESKDLITEMGHTEIFEFYETSSQRQCRDCAAYWETGIVYCTCGKCMQTTEKSRQFNKDRFDTLSIPGYVIKKNQSRGLRHGPSLRQTLYHKARDMLLKAKLPKNGSGQTILERWHRDNKYCMSLPEECWQDRGCGRQAKQPSRTRTGSIHLDVRENGSHHGRVQRTHPLSTSKRGEQASAKLDNTGGKEHGSGRCCATRQEGEQLQGVASRVVDG